jgi:hypothetical protein
MAQLLQRVTKTRRNHGRALQNLDDSDTAGLQYNQFCATRKTPARMRHVYVSLHTEIEFLR